MPTVQNRWVGNAYSYLRIFFRSVNRRNPEIIAEQICIDFDTQTYRFGYFSGPSNRVAHAGWPAGWLVGWLAASSASGTPTCVKNVNI